jgi:alpha-tubulin suppressor-like RCC1 family protein
VDSTVTVKARAFRADWTPSTVASAAYTITSGAVAAPTFDVGSGFYTTSPTLTMSTATSGATIRYTITGADPTESDAEVPAGGLLVDRAMIVKARAFKAGMLASGVTRADYIVTGGLAAGWYHALLLKADGTVLTTGQNGYGQLGHGNTTNRSTYAAVAALPDGRAVAAGNYHSLVLRSDGSVWAFGYNGSGQLGDASTTNRTSPVQVKGVGGAGFLTGIVAIAARGNNSYAIRGSDGVVFAWGLNTNGQLGNGTTTGSNVPVQVSGLGGVIAVAAGDGHALALKSDGTVYGFGLNNYGQLGDGTNTQRTTPVAVSTLYGVRKLATLPLSSYAVKADGLISGRLWAFGHNFYGQLGDGTNNAKNKPISGMGEVIDVAGGSSSVHAADVHGKTWGWGYNDSYAIGDGSGLARSSPVLVSALKDPVALAGGSAFTVALRANGELYGWGSNGSGQIGDGTLTTRTKPAVVSGVSVASNGWLLTDTDGDGLKNIAEYRYGTDPLDPDSNDNGIQDGLEEELGGKSASSDTDGDGLSNAAELAAGTDPNKADTDGDGVLDGADQWPLDPTRSVPSYDPSDQTPPSITLQEPSGAVQLP